MLAFVAYAAMRLWHPDRSAAQSQEAPIPKYETAPEQTTSQRTEQVQADASVSSIQLNQKEQTDIGVETVEVRRRNLQRALMAVAKVDEPETQLASISARIGGRIDKLYLDFTGQQVRRGQTIASLYSPEVFSAAEEYRLSLENRKRLGTGAEPLAVSGAEDLVTASRRRLELWGLTPEQLDEIASSLGEASDRAPHLFHRRRHCDRTQSDAGAIRKRRRSPLYHHRPEHDLGESGCLSA